MSETHPIHVQMHITLEVTPAQLAAMLTHAEGAKRPPSALGQQETQDDPANTLQQGAPTPAAEEPQPAKRRPGRPSKALMDARVQIAPVEPPEEVVATAELPPEVEDTPPPPAEAAPGNGVDHASEEITEPAMRTLLSQLSNVIPSRVEGVVKLLMEHGGNARLLDCPRETWPAIAAAAREQIQAQAI